MPKKPLDANKPRGPVTAYALFVRTCRDELRRKYPQLNVDYNVIAKKCSERWKVMSDNEKKRFNDSVESQRKRYKEEMATYNQEQSIKQQQQQQSATSSILVQTPATQFLLESPSLQQQQHTLIMSAPAQHAGIGSAMKRPTKKRERKPKDPLAPKKPLSAYFLFCADERAKVMGSQSGLSVSDVARELGARWKNISAELKQKYEQSASEKKLAFIAEMTAYKHQSSTGSSPPATPQTPSTPHDYQSTFSSSSSSVHHQHPQLEQLLLQQQHFHSFDANDISDPTAVFDILADENPLDDSDD